MCSVLRYRIHITLSRASDGEVNYAQSFREAAAITDICGGREQSRQIFCSAAKCANGDRPLTAQAASTSSGTRVAIPRATGSSPTTIAITLAQAPPPTTALWQNGTVLVAGFALVGVIVTVRAAHLRMRTELAATALRAQPA